jgi:hypothetical protein
LPLDPTKDAVLDFKLVYYPYGKDSVKININGRDIGFWNDEISGSGEWDYHKRLVLPHWYLAKDGMNKLVLIMLSPIAAGNRIVGLPVMSITIKSKSSI